MSTFLHGYELKGVKESVANFISNISPQETPFSSMTKKVSEHNTTFSWLTDVDDTVTVPGTAIKQGDDAAFAELVEPKKLTSFTQIFARAAKVDGTAEAMGLYGRGKPMAYQMMKAGRAIKKEIEMTLLAKQDGKGATSGAGGQLDGFLTRRADASGIASPLIPLTNIVKSTAAGVVGFVEADLQNVLLKVWKAGGRPSVIMFPPEFAAAMSALRETGNTGVNMFDGEAAVEVNRKVDTYVDPLGQRLKLVVNQWMPANYIYVLDPSMFEQRILRNFSTKDLPANGDYVAKQLVVELGLANKNPAACGVYNLTGTAIATAEEVVSRKK